MSLPVLAITFLGLALAGIVLYAAYDLPNGRKS